ncbi:MAG TPA: PKD domain-containing protein [Planctomycetota bacterium]|nr:PKD domain-containing protein [Planctomycetota bacterium]
MFFVFCAGFCAAADSSVTTVQGLPAVFGGNTYGQCNVPVGIYGVKSIAVGNHTLAVKDDGTVLAWGRNVAGECNVPPGLTNVIAVATGAEHSLALKSDGTVVAWGGNGSGECNVPTDLNGVTAIAAGYSYYYGGDVLSHGYSVALKSDGTVAAWGSNVTGQCDIPLGLNGVIAIATSGPIVAALKSDGTVVQWGFPGDNYYWVPRPSEINGVIGIAVGNLHVVALKSDGTVVAWGRNEDGQCNVPPDLNGVVQVAAGGKYTLALKNDGSIVSWGINDMGQLNVPSGLQGISSIAAGFHVSAVLHSGTLPTARFICSEVVGFVGLPLAFDATFSTDPENQIVSYQWDFGDGSPAGTEKIMSKIYNAEGTYSVTLTVRDADGLTHSLTREIVVLPKTDVGLFNGFIVYKVRWDRTSENKDTLSLTANVNVGDSTVGSGTPVALEIAGERFEGVLNSKLQFSNAQSKWQVKANSRGQSFGETRVKLTIKKASLGLGFNIAGAVVGPDPHDIVSLDIPVHLEIAGKIFEVPIASDFKFSDSGKKANGTGEGP